MVVNGGFDKLAAFKFHTTLDDSLYTESSVLELIHNEKVTGLICENDLVALQTMKTLQDSSYLRKRKEIRGRKFVYLKERQESFVVKVLIRYLDNLLYTMDSKLIHQLKRS